MIDQEVVDYLRDLDISVLSLNDILSRLSEHFKADFSDKKDKIEEILVELNIDSEHSNDDLNDHELARKLQKEECRHSFRRRAKKKARAKATKKSTTQSTSTNSVFTRPLLVSKSLQVLTNKDTCSRPEVVKIVWKYIKERNLQDPSDKRFIICDDALFEIFKKKRVSCFGMNRELSKHLYPKAETVVGAKRDHDGIVKEKLVRIPNTWIEAGFVQPEMTYHQLQLEIVKLLKDFRTEDDPDTIFRGSDDTIVSDLMPKDKDFCSTSEIFRNLRLKFKGQLNGS